MKLKTKLSLALGFLFLVILSFGISGILFTKKLSSDSDRILKNNYETLVFVNNMLKTLDALPGDKNALNEFETNLEKQEKNITEPGEETATTAIRNAFNKIKNSSSDPSDYREIRSSIQTINSLNQNAILHKSDTAHKTAEDATLWLTGIFVILTLIAFTLVVNFPGVIANPISVLSEGITQVANKNYSKRIYLEQKDEFGDLAAAFNIMAEKLNEYEHSNLAQLKFEKSRIETIINQMKDGIIGLDGKRNILFLNETAEKILGLKEKDIITKYAPDIAIRNDLMRTLLQEETNNKELKIYADRKESYFNKDILNVTDSGIIIGQVIVLRNVTPFYELNEAKTNFIAIVSHELKTPISSIKMSAKLLTDDRIGALSTEQRELINSVSEDADRLLKITGELLNMAQVETGNIQLKYQSTPPGNIVDTAIEAVKFKAQQNNNELKIDMEASLSPINVDAEKTTWVLINLLTNAIKYSPAGSAVELSVHQKNNRVNFSVKDYGRGIEHKYLSKIFGRYFKVPGNNEHQGTGLGLSICKEFIEAQGGTICVKSVINEGSTFGFWFNS